jgi:hypothetical protein
VRENRTHGSEGGDGDSRSRPLSGLFSPQLAWIPAFAGMTNPGREPLSLIAAKVFSKETRRNHRSPVRLSVPLASHKIDTEVLP